MINNSFNFRKIYSRSDLVDYISSNPEKSGQIIKYNLAELGKLKGKSKLWFEIHKGKIHRDDSNIIFRKLRTLFSLSKGFDEEKYLKAFKIFAETYFSIFQPDKDSAHDITIELRKARDGLKHLKRKDNPSVAKLEKLFDKLILDIQKRAEIQPQVPLDFLKNRGKYWKKISNWKTSKKEGKEEILKEAYVSAKLMLKSRSRYEAVLHELETKKENWHQLFQELLQLAPRSPLKHVEDFDQSLLAEFLLSVEKESEFRSLIKKLKKYDELSKSGHSDKEIRKLKQVAIWKSGLLYYTPGTIPKDKKSTPIIPPGFRVHAIIEGIAKTLAGGLTITLGILFPPLLLFAGAGVKLAKDGVELILNKKDSILNPESILDGIVKSERVGKNIKNVINLGDELIKFSKSNEISKTVNETRTKYY